MPLGYAPFILALSNMGFSIKKARTPSFADLSIVLFSASLGSPRMPEVVLSLIGSKQKTVISYLSLVAKSQYL
jgi:hypothetical protein